MKRNAHLIDNSAERFTFLLWLFQTFSRSRVRTRHRKHRLARSETPGSKTMKLQLLVVWLGLVVFTYGKMHRHIQARHDLKSGSFGKRETTQPGAWGPRVSVSVMDNWRETTMQTTPLKGSCDDVLQQVTVDLFLLLAAAERD